MEDKIIIIGSYVITFLLGRIYGIYGARKIVDKSIFKEENHFLGFTDPSRDMKLDIGGFSKQMTAVEWLLERVCNDILDDEYINKLSIEKTQLFNKISIQAKQMEKEQIQKAFSDGQEIPINHPTLPHYSREEYYNDNYNK